MKKARPHFHQMSVRSSMPLDPPSRIRLYMPAETRGVRLATPRRGGARGYPIYGYRVHGSSSLESPPPPFPAPRHLSPFKKHLQGRAKHGQHQRPCLPLPSPLTPCPTLTPTPSRAVWTWSSPSAPWMLPAHAHRRQHQVRLVPELLNRTTHAAVPIKGYLSTHKHQEPTAKQG